MLAPLTAPMVLAYAGSVKTARAVSGLRRDAERRFLVSGLCEPECPANREAWGVLADLNNTRAFILPGNVKTARRYAMCISKREIRPGIGGIIDHIDTIDEVKSKISPIITFLTLSDNITGIAALTNEELSQLGWLLRDMLDEVFQASEGIYKIFQQEV